MKRYKFFLSVVVAVLILLFNVNTAQATTSGDYEYEVQSDGTVIITDYTGNDSEITIPSTIDDKAVTALDDWSFAYISTLEEVTIPDTVTTLNYGAFMYSGLTTITIPSSVTSMSTHTFQYCESLETVTINANIEELPTATFVYCTGLKQVTLSSTITTLGVQSFAGCSSLTDLSFLSGVNYISQQCFMYCDSLTEVTIPSNVIQIDPYAFDDTVTLDLSQSRLAKNGEYYVISTEITLEGVCGYERVFELLDLINEEREAAGLDDLTMDAELLDAAMTRATEIVLNYSSTRPNGLNSYTVLDSIDNGFILKGYKTPSLVLDSLMNSESNKEVVLDSIYETVGIGCFYFNGVHYWTVYFSTGDLREEAVKTSNATEERSVYVTDEYISLSLNTDYVKIKPGEEYQVSIFNNSIACNSRCATWESSDTSIATVDSNGNIKGIKNGKTTITVTLGLDTETITVFVQQYTDVEDTWYTEYINYCSENGLMTGYSNTTLFGPTDNILRGQIVLILYRMEGSPAVKTSSSFTDVQDSSKYYYKAVIWALENKIVTGYGETGLFKPENSITREEFATILYRYADYKGLDVPNTASLSKFADSSSVSEWAEDAIKWTAGTGIITGITSSDGKTVNISPKGNATRAQAATMIMRFCEL